jgi:hypothetical protein
MASDVAGVESRDCDTGFAMTVLGMAVLGMRARKMRAIDT